MTRTVITTHYKATTPSGDVITGEVLTSMSGRQLVKYIKKVHGIEKFELSSYFTTDKYKLSDEDFIKYATKVEN
jgi:hypothetical protein